MILALLATLGAIVVAFVLYPVFTEATAGAFRGFDEADIALSDLRDKKAMLYESIQDLDFEKAAGKVSDADYQSARNDYLAQVTRVLEQLDALEPSEPEPAAKPTPQRNPEKQSTPKRERECSSCGATNPTGSNFCLECGTPFAKACASCGESLPDNARFCNACGEKVSA